MLVKIFQQMRLGVVFPSKSDPFRRILKANRELAVALGCLFVHYMKNILDILLPLIRLFKLVMFMKHARDQTAVFVLPGSPLRDIMETEKNAGKKG